MELLKHRVRVRLHPVIEKGSLCWTAAIRTPCCEKLISVTTLSGENTRLEMARRQCPKCGVHMAVSTWPV